MMLHFLHHCVHAWIIFLEQIKCSGKAHDIFQWEAMRTLSRSIHEKTTYKLMAERLMLPEKFYHPIGSAENRREILMGLSPMLNDADTHRKQEVEACETFTKCKSSKVKTRNSYEYIDVVTMQAVDFTEYERRYDLKHMFMQRRYSNLFILLFYFVRYIRFITATKVNRQLNYALQLQPALVTFSSKIPDSVPLEDKENIPAQALSSAPSSAVKPLRKRKHANTVLGLHQDSDVAPSSKSGGARRETLSPGTVRKLLIEKVETAMSPASDSTSVVGSSKSEPTTVEDAAIAVPDYSSTSTGSMSPIGDIDLVAFDDESLTNASSTATKRRDQCGRRSTLSPTAARLIAMEIMTEEPEEVPQSEETPLSEEVQQLKEVQPEEVQQSSPVATEEFVAEVALISHASDSLVEPDANHDISAEETEDAVLDSETIVSSAKKSTSECVEAITDNRTQCDEDCSVNFDVSSPQSRLLSTPSRREAIPRILLPIDGSHLVDTVLISLASEVSDMIAQSPTRRFFGRKSEGNIVHRGLEILGGSESELEAFEMLESFVSSAILAKSMEAESPHFISPERDSKRRSVGSSGSKPAKSLDELIIFQSEVAANSEPTIEEAEEKSSDEAAHLADEIDELDWERRASQRMRERFAAARWQYLWEIVSAQAANKAINAARKKQKFL